MRISHLSAALAALTLAASSATAGPFDRLFVFGDSLSDAGNVAAAGMAAGHPAFQSGGKYDPTYYVQGRFSNGPNYADVLASGLGLSLQPSLLGGTNFAFGGASTGAGTSPADPDFPDVGVPNVGVQIGMFAATAPTVTARDLFVLWAGANDYINAPGFPPSPEVVVANLVGHLGQLADMGVQHILVPNLPFLGALPATLERGDDVSAFLNFLTLQHNALLDVALDGFRAARPGVTIYELKVDEIVLGIAANPAAAGFTNVSDRAFLWQSGTVVPGAEGYVFWDDVHPTARTHALLGQAALAVVVPEPSGLTLAGIGAASAGLVALRRRRRAA